MKRKLIHRTDENISYLQIMGFIVIIAGIIYLFIRQLFSNLSSEVIAIDFFTIMLGIIFAFPDLLKDANNGLSTMRIVVFMVINVFCLLALKLGWEAKNFKDIGVDQYWTGIIAFVFGAKATQSFFESKLAVATTQAETTLLNNSAGTGGAAAAAGAADANDGCGGPPGKPTEDSELPVSKGGVA
ncbi:hypothetical protein [Mucilaginibacter sp.]|uniref:hypothetical protein n=1 Tax=Mucilaginibacter sp. TaxID=1882438 RepID=UPI002ED35ED1